MDNSHLKKEKKRSSGIIALKAFLFVLVFGAGFLVSFFVIGSSYDRCSNEFTFINPVFACLEKITINKKAYIDLKINLTSFIDKEKKDGRAQEVGMFFRDLEAGPTLGINDRADFIPASLLKLPHILTLMRLSEEEFPNLFSQKLMYDDKDIWENEQTFLPREIIKVNTPYMVDELIERSMQYSDNFADKLLLRHIESFEEENDLVVETYRDLGILASSDINSASVSVKGYSSIFRLLFSSSFLDKDNSEKLLKILSESSFNEGLRQGVPLNIKIAHKFGERTIESSGEKQLHDCGIIYYPDNPYLLCVMTKGADFSNLQKIIGHISEEVYKEFDSRSIKNYK